jgi:hypothetical protein
MPYPFHRLGKVFFSSTSLLLVATSLNAAQSRVFFHSAVPGPHIIRNYTLYNKEDTTEYHPVATEYHPAEYRPAAGLITREKNGNLVIAVPPAMLGRYKIRFFDEDHYFLFEIRQIRDSLLIVEKNSFQHAGLFQYELYRDNALIERSSFSIRKDKPQ